MQIHRGALPKPAWQLASSNIFWILFASPTLSSSSLTPKNLATTWEQSFGLYANLLGSDSHKGNRIIKQWAEVRGKAKLTVEGRKEAILHSGHGGHRVHGGFAASGCGLTYEVVPFFGCDYDIPPKICRKYSRDLNTQVI
jgi:hypothetical protein